MTSQSRDVAIITSAHWSGDPRLNRHLTYLAAAGYDPTLVSAADARSRLGAIGSSLASILRTKAKVVILPDPELFVIGSLISRVSRKKPILDIHEDYVRTVDARDWARRPLRPVVRFLARLVIAAGRRLAWRVIVAAPHLARTGDGVVENIPDPESLSRQETQLVDSRDIVYVGDVTISRGALEMVEVLSHLDGDFTLTLIGRIDDSTKVLITDRARELRTEGRTTIAGRLPHQEAWDHASGGLVGLCLLRPLPPYQQAVATKIWEYMAVGLPPVVSDLPGQAAVVSEIDAALVCGSPADAAEVVRAIAEDPRWRAHLSARCREVIEARWSELRPDLALQKALSP